MNKHLILCGLAATMFMASCSNEGDITATSTTPTDNGEQIKVTLNQNSTITRASLGNKTDGAYDGTFDTDQLGIYCLATGKIYANENITWNDPNDNPNMLWMQNIRAKAVTTATATSKKTDLVWYDGTARYYPMGSQYAYTFYGYYPYTTAVKHVGNKYYVEVNNIGGTTDVIWGKSENPANEPHAYSALYFREKKAQDGAAYNQDNYLPNVKFVHKLMKFNIILKKGTGSDLDKIGIKKAELLNAATKGTLVIASLDNPDEEGVFTPNWNTTTTLTLKSETDDPLDDNQFLGANDQITVGGGFLLPVLPKNGDTYVDNGYTDGGMQGKGVFRLRVDFHKQGDATIYKAAQYEVVPPAEGWKEGYEYNIIISVSSPLEIQATTTLVPWTQGDINLQ